MAALALLAGALERGVRFFDTADVYGLDENDLGHNERLLREALAARRGAVFAGVQVHASGVRGEFEPQIARRRRERERGIAAVVALTLDLSFSVPLRPCLHGVF